MAVLMAALTCVHELLDAQARGEGANKTVVPLRALSASTLIVRLGFGVWGLELRVRGEGFGVQS